MQKQRINVTGTFLWTVGAVALCLWTRATRRG